jgi:hypothetical protein
MRCWPYLLAEETPGLLGRTIGVEDPFSAGRKFSKRLAHTQGPLDEIASAIWAQTFRESRNTRRAESALERTNHRLVGRSEINVAALATRPHLKHKSSLHVRVRSTFSRPSSKCQEAPSQRQKQNPPCGGFSFLAETAGAVGSPQDCRLPNPDTDTTKPTKTRPERAALVGGDGGI